jgi:hypothetical protein
MEPGDIGNLLAKGSENGVRLQHPVCVFYAGSARAIAGGNRSVI